MSLTRSRLPDENDLKSIKNDIKAKLTNADMKIMRLEKILQKKALSKPKQSLPIAETTLAVGGFPVQDFRMPHRSTTVPRVHKEIVPHGANSEPAVKGAAMEKIHMKHLQRTVCKREIEARMAELEMQAKKKEAAKSKKAKKVPKNIVPASMLPNRYVRGELPCTIEHGANGHYLSWACPLENLDYEYYLPLFFDGLQCSEQPVCFLARQGCEDLLYSAYNKPERIIPCVHLLVRPLRNALMKFDPEVLLGVLKAIQQLLKSGPGVGEALLPYGKQFMSPMAIYLEDCKNIGDSIDYAQRRNNDVGEEVRATLELFEETGGPKALKAIKFSVPTYQSCLQPANFRKG